MDTKSSKCVHLVEGGTNGPQYVNMAPMGKTSLGRVIHARKRQKTSFTNLETHGDGSRCLACDTCSSGVPNEIVPAGIVPIGNLPVGNNIGFQTRTKGGLGEQRREPLSGESLVAAYTVGRHFAKSMRIPMQESSDVILRCTPFSPEVPRNPLGYLHAGVRVVNNAWTIDAGEEAMELLLEAMPEAGV